MKIVAQYKDELAEIFLREDHIAEVQLLARDYNKALVDKVIRNVRRLVPDEKPGILILAHDKSAVTLNGIRELFSQESLTYASAKAYVIHKPAHFVLAKVCMLVYHPTLPIRFFSRKEEAEAWLASVMKNDNRNRN
jgi:hypothetical protein